MKRALALLFAAILLLSCGSVLAADPGSVQDPLLSRSYVLQWQEMLLTDRAARVEDAAQSLKVEGARSRQMLLGRCGKNGVRRETLPAGGSVLLQSGDSMTLLSGGGGIAVHFGSLIDVTAGTVFSPGGTPPRHRLIAAQNAWAVFTAAAESELLLTGTAVVSRYGDSAPGQWYGAAVDYATVRALMNGTEEDAFSPVSTLTRAMFVTVLGRLAGVNESDYPGASFSDVPVGTWYSAFVQWGARKGIVNGTGEDAFEPDSPVTREQMAVLITRYADAERVDLPRGVSTPYSFRDEDSVSDWAFESVERMRLTGLLNGDENGNFNPRSGATRAEAATVFMRLDATWRLL